VQAKGFQEERKSELALADSTAVATKLRAAYPGATVVRRTWVGGLLTSPRNASAVTVEGIEPDAEATLTLLDDRLKDGHWLDDDRGILLGDLLVSTLGVGVGDKVVFMTQVGGGEMQSRLFRVAGVFHTGNEMLDAFGALARIEATQELLPVADAAHQVAVIVPGAGKAEVPTAPAAAVAPGADVLSWRQALPLLEEQEALDENFSGIFYLAMGLIVAVGVLNTVLMSVMERVREFGVLRAIGMRSRPLFAMIVAEGLVLGVLGAIASVLLAAPAIHWLVVHGIDLGDVLSANSPVGGVAIDTVMRARWVPATMLGYAASAVVLAVAASLWPAWKATRLRPVDAIHHT
jgi:ABC-type lipoprotein release transport system permease subunit